MRLAVLFAVVAALAPGSARAEAPATEWSPFRRGLSDTVLAWREWGQPAQAEAQRDDRLLFVLLGPSALEDCAMPEAGLFARPDIHAALERSYVPVAVDRLEHPELQDLFATALSLLAPEAEPEGRALWIVATPEGWPLAAGPVRDDRAFVTGFGAQLDAQARRYNNLRGEARTRAGLLAAQLREAQASEPAQGTLQRDVVARALKGLRDAAGPSGRLAGQIHGPLRLLLAEASSGNPEARRLLVAPLDGLALAKPACAPRLAEQAQALRALTLGYALTGNAAWRGAAQALSADLLARRDASGAFGTLASDERVFAASDGLAIGALALSSQHLGRPQDLAAARVAAQAVLARLGPAKALRRVALGDEARGAGLLADHVFMAEGLLELWEVSGEARWRDEAVALVDAALGRFSDPAGGCFDTSMDPTLALPARPRSGYDGELPAPNAVLASVLARLALATGETRYADLARGTLTAFLGDLQRAPRGVATMAAVAGELLGRPAPAAGVAPSYGARETRGALSAELSLVPARVRGGESFEARLQLGIAPGRSLNAHQPGSHDLYGLTASLLSADLKAGAPIYSPAANVPRRFSKETILGYVGSAVVKLPVSVPAGTRPGDRPVRVRLGFQACDERQCQPPDSVVLEVPVTVVAR